ncbi:MAG: PTS transporter subunit EIIA [Anaerolineales bacterium]|nr:PTS transporter subunit EIIA [Anaerolineales bacterium]
MAQGSHRQAKVNSWIEEELVVTRLHATSAKDAIARLGGLLHKHGYVTDSFVEAALEREEMYSTGLATPTLPVAIPHAGAEHVRRTGIAIGILDKPVDFNLMGTPDHTLSVKIVFLLAVRHSKALGSFMTAIVEILRDKDLLPRIANANGEREIVDLMMVNLPTPEAL